MKKTFGIQWRYVGTNNWQSYWRNYTSEKARDDAVVTLNRKEAGNTLIKNHRQFRAAK